ncbi:glycoside hydrolase family 2 protein [uncultured Photobacterium sp.]|uniref:glycoside hydrolase family 2 protein n=1 Tax=uncultured Photobacterium sp. TaxID=173973 RepID=UPI00260411A8|nr:glycoside hydrolase family 2 TIM barrel-domain containing protein [uncultured Photobacterium sp.]
MRIILLMCVLFSLSSCAYQKPKEQWQTSKRSLGGTWQLEIIDEEQGSSAFHDVVVPGNWTSSGVEHAGSGYYQKKIQVSEMLPKSRYWLHFDAIDYESAVVLNGKYLAKHKGYFSPQVVEATGALKRGGNLLNVWVHSPNEKQKRDWSLHKTTIKGVMSHHDTRPGGAWSDRGQDKNSGGIWGAVSLRETGPVAIKAVKIMPIVRDVDKQLTSGTVSIEIDSQYQGELQLRISLEKTGSELMPETYQLLTDVKRGEQKVSWDLPIKERQLWWPWDWGEPSLYRFEVAAWVGDRVSDINEASVGFRKIKLDEAEGKFYVNEIPYFIRGTNYIASQWLGEIAEKDYLADLLLMKEANINSIRVHAHVAGKDFYHLADQQGLIVWQDFPLQWGYTDNPDFVVEAVTQTQDMTNMLFNHPSIAFWCAHNEPPWDADWMKYKYSSYSPEQNKVLTESVYQQLLKADDGRVVRKASYTYEHPWLGWYSGTYRDYKDFKAPVIVSEFGAQGLPELDLIDKILGTPSEWPLSEEVITKLKYHNYQPHETVSIAGVPQGDSLSQFVINSQEYQRVVTKYAAEHLRLKKEKGVAAVYQFMFVDSWPAITWSVLDVNRSPKLGYFAIKEAYQPVVAIAELDSNENVSKLSISVINDSLLDYFDSVVEIKNKYDGKSWRIDEIDIINNTISNVVLNREMIGLSHYFLIRVIDSKGNVISENNYQASDM